MMMTKKRTKLKFLINLIRMLCLKVINYIERLNKSSKFKTKG
jgi:hypothetical protein